MLYQKFIRLIESHAEQLTSKWVKEVKNNPATKGYKNIDDKILHKRAFDDFQRLGNILLHDDPTFRDQAAHFMKLGKDRAAEGLKLSEVMFAFILSRAVLWNFVIDQGIINNTLDLQQALEFYQKVTNFYDKASYFIARGYENINTKSDKFLHDEAFIEQTVKAVTKWFIKEIK